MEIISIVHLSFVCNDNSNSYYMYHRLLIITDTIIADVMISKKNVFIVDNNNKHSNMPDAAHVSIHWVDVLSMLGGMGHNNNKNKNPKKIFGLSVSFFVDGGHRP